MLLVSDKRTVKTVKNIIAAIIFKGASILISLILVPLTLSYLTSYEYGVWLTLSSVMTWIYVLDIGLGNGLRNRLSEALALNDMELAKIYVSTAFYSLLLIVFLVYLIFLLLQHWVDWNVILNITGDRVANINSIVTIVFAFFCCSFVLKIIGNIYMAYQQSAINDLLSLLGNFLSFILIYLCTIFIPSSLEKVAFIFSGAPVVVFLIAYPITFKKYKSIRPSLKFVRIKYFKELMSLGTQFFIIQIACLVLFMTSNLVISQLFGPEEVTPYNIAFKYFSLVNIGFTVILTPIWSAITEAYTIKDMVWIRKVTKKLLWIWLGSVMITLLMIYIADKIYIWWVGDDVNIPFSLSFVCGIYVCIANWNNIFAYIINGIGKIRLQLYSSILAAILFLPLAFFFGRLWEISGVMLAMCFCLFISSVWSPIQYWKIISDKAQGIWNK